MAIYSPQSGALFANYRGKVLAYYLIKSRVPPPYEFPPISLSLLLAEFIPEWKLPLGIFFINLTFNLGNSLHRYLICFKTYFLE